MITFRVDNLKSMNVQLKEFCDFLRAHNVADEAVFNSRLVSCELISNVIKHGGEAATFKGELTPDKIVITVRAESQRHFELRPQRPEVLSESGRGLYIINCVSISGIKRGEGDELIVHIKR